jgi:hypothetical protein
LAAGDAVDGVADDGADAEEEEVGEEHDGRGAAHALPVPGGGGGDEGGWEEGETICPSSRA